VNCHEAEKSEAIAKCKVMPNISVNKVMDKKRFIGKGGPRRRRGTRGH
jgi:hypothetical protein